MDSLHIYHCIITSVVWIGSTTTSYATDIGVATNSNQPSTPEPVMLAFIGGLLLVIGFIARHLTAKKNKQNKKRRPKTPLLL